MPTYTGGLSYIGTLVRGRGVEAEEVQVARSTDLYRQTRRRRVHPENPRELPDDVPHILRKQKNAYIDTKATSLSAEGQSHPERNLTAKIASDWFNGTNKEILLPATRRGDVCWCR